VDLKKLGVVAFTSAIFLIAGVAQAVVRDLPVEGMVTMVDLGAKSCVPCKMMAPVLEKLEKEYQGIASIVFIDVWKNREQAARFKVQIIPTQIFFDATGKEVWRHVGFMSEEAIVAQLDSMNVPKPGTIEK